ncbi:ATP-binding protein [Zavarzinia sp. CC-PAN008]|uniref:ATP-binding protein n=1 Tax=Zavarzinia sp. CC-PAN008 TaxID=3243332 RepID=UPI003F744450
MTRLYECLTQQHDLKLVLLAVLVALLSFHTLLAMAARGKAAPNPNTATLWLLSAGAVGGVGLWAAHMVLVLSYRTVMPVGYDLPVVTSSVLVAVSTAALAVQIAVHAPASRWLSGALLMVGAGAVHLMCVAAFRVPARVEYALDYSAIGMALGLGLGIWAFARLPDPGHWAARLCCAAVLTLGLALAHLVAMAGVEVVLDPAVAAGPGAVHLPTWAGIALGGTAVVALVMAIAGSAVDEQRARRTQRENRHLRDEMAILRSTKAALEANSASLSAALQAAEIANQDKSAFLATMSHELRTPLNAVIGFADMLAQETFGPLGNARYVDYACSIRDSGQHLLALINDLLDFSKIDAGHLHVTDEEMDLPAIIGGILMLMRLQAAEGGINLAHDVDPDLPLVRGDPRRVRQILLNLVSNAVKFTPSRGTITISAYALDGTVRIQVRDTGAGIAPEDIPRALERFGQVDRGTPDLRNKGTGLGLPLSKALMELHGGTLVLESRLGAGTCVTLTFPRERVGGQVSEAA